MELGAVASSQSQPILAILCNYFASYLIYVPCVAKNWWALGLTMAIGLPALFEVALRRGFRLQVHEWRGKTSDVNTQYHVQTSCQRIAGGQVHFMTD